MLFKVDRLEERRSNALLLFLLLLVRRELAVKRGGNGAGARTILTPDQHKSCTSFSPGRVTFPDSVGKVLAECD